jgi:hypothetical protein
MIRTALWFLFWCLCLGFASVRVEYRDGLKIRLFSHKERRAKP